MIKRVGSSGFGCYFLQGLTIKFGNIEASDMIVQISKRCVFYKGKLGVKAGMG